VNELSRYVFSPLREGDIAVYRAKTGEERYQTAAGVEADLRRCLADLELCGRIDRFPLGEQWVDRLLIPEKLYGRNLDPSMMGSLMSLG
jgi:hypothetical protein